VVKTHGDGLDFPFWKLSHPTVQNAQLKISEPPAGHLGCTGTVDQQRQDRQHVDHIIEEPFQQVLGKGEMDRLAAHIDD
jgi:hypothetical protein